MSAVAKFGANPMADLRSWLGADLGLALPSLGGAPFVRIEDYMDEGTYVLRADLPGIDPDKDVEITTADDELTIKGERSEESHERGHDEFHYGSFARSISLPRGSRTEEISAEYRGGVLEVRVPVDDSAPAARKIPVARAES
ncbi:Hsp20/alpha crystallin family protein [Nocardioides gilvus]|uniref:Hsp20/alpha crystallin family protein n=1 Tax=Nocardioides gilvus TaxID=1735589 RepID=UPI000D749C74|nr:Hsp20/alpha crystallin family protein [Nocardioides gilvus]